ncbi:MAG: LysR substrate-binding domain-containing protein [Ruthenibacterium lactatiformans]
MSTAALTAGGIYGGYSGRRLRAGPSLYAGPDRAAGRLPRPALSAARERQRHREQFDSAAAAAGFTVAPVWESTSTLALVNAATRGLGVAVLPLRMAADALEKGQVAVFRVDGLDLSRKFRLVHHRDKFLTASAREFLALCRAQGDAARERV